MEFSNRVYCPRIKVPELKNVQERTAFVTPANILSESIVWPMKSHHPTPPD